MPEKVQNGFLAYDRLKRSSAGLEKDFTTPGALGKLQCPFTQGKGALPTPPNGSKDIDPIKTDFQPVFSSPPPSAAGSASKCPIRFLDQQSPEKVAQYFEEHKHEIPRSHEICVKRYQSNSESIRQLDAKYGNLVSMIQGLGATHQQYLKETDRDRTSVERVEQWAEGVSIKSENFVEEEEDDRTGHFERSLRDVRLGESPSRPWGIQVPLAQQPVRSALASEPVMTESPQKSREMEHPTMPAQDTRGRCPFGHSKPSLSSEKEKVAGTQKSTSSPTPARTEFVFKGPVFFGYSADDAIKMMQAGIDFGQSTK